MITHLYLYLNYLPIPLTTNTYSHTPITPGIAAGTFSAAVTTPLDVIKVGLAYLLLINYYPIPIWQPSVC